MKMETYFPHITNGLTAPQRVKKRSKILPLTAIAIIVAAIYFIAF